MKKETLFTTILAAMILIGCSKDKSSEEAGTIAEIQAKQGIPVTAVQVSKGTVSHVEQANGTLEGIQQTALSNAIGGTVGKIRVKVGQVVKKGTVVAEMLIDGGSPVIPAKTNFEYAKQSYERAVRLHAEGAVSQEQVEGAKTQYEAARIKLGQAKAGVKVKAPFTGTVLEIYQSRGNKIPEKSPIVKIADLRKMKVQMQVNERSINLFKEGQQAFILMESDTLWGAVDRTALSANTMSHSFRVTAHFDNPEGVLKSGMFKNVYVVVDKKENTLKIPFEIVSFEGEKSFVYCVDGDKAVKTEVNLGIRNGTEFEVTEGVNADDRVILTGMTLINDGSKINVVER